MSAFEQAVPREDATSRRAADYFQRRHFWDWSDADQAELEAWLAESSLHRAAFLRVQGIASYTEHLAAIHPFDIRAARGGNGPFRGWMIYPLLAAAAIALIAGVGAPLTNYLMPSPDRTYSTDVGGRTLLTFADQTQIELNTDTVVRFRMTGDERKVWLEKGEAWFHVSHNATNPFTVFVGKHRITDLGTEFLIRRGGEGLEVALLNGRATLSAEGSPATTLTPGDDAIATPVSLSVTRKPVEQLADEMAWRQGMLVFRQTPLAQVVREFNRYNTTKLVIADPSIADVKITADLKTNHYEDFLQLAQTMLDLRVDREGNNILISREHHQKTTKAARTTHGL